MGMPTPTLHATVPNKSQSHACPVCGAMPSMRERILRHITTHWQEHGQPCTSTEIAQALGYQRSEQVGTPIAHLLDLGLIKRVSWGKYRPA
jgi:hypothetical protein